MVEQTVYFTAEMSTTTPPQQVSPSEAVIYQVANHENVDPMDLSPLYDVVDPDALDSLVGTANGNGADLQIEFTYAGYNVTVTGDGAVEVDDAIVPHPTM